MKTFVRIWLGIGLISIGLGIALLVLATARGATLKDVSVFSMNKSYEGIERLDFQINYAEVIIIEGKEFNIDAKNLFTDNFESYVEGNTWIIKESSNHRLNVFGLSFPVSLWWDDYNFNTPRITITVPAGFEAKSLNLDIKAGRLEADKIRAVKGSLSVEAGEIKINELIIEEESVYNIGAGRMLIKNMDVSNISVDCGIGSVEMKGKILGDSNIRCGVGHIDLQIKGNKEDYSYRIDCGVGSVIINEDNFKNISSRKIVNNGAIHNLNLDCGIGHISVRFK